MFNTAMEDIEQTFNTPTPKEYGGTGHVFGAPATTASGSIGIGTTPALLMDNGKGVALGDPDTGIRQNGDGVLELVANNVVIQTLSNEIFSKGATGGFTRLLGNFILQYGVYTSGATAGAVTLPVAYPTTHILTVGNILQNSPTTMFGISIHTRTLTQFSFTKQFLGTGSGGIPAPATDGFMWVSLGY